MAGGGKGGQDSVGAIAGSRRAWPPQAAWSWRGRPAHVWRALRQNLAEAVAGALDHRRLFVLLPFGVIFGLVLYAGLDAEPTPITLGIGSALIGFALVLVLARQSLSGLRWAGQLAALWCGFCLLPLHGLAFGTPMLAFPVYGDYEARIDAVLSSSADGRRVIVSALTPRGDSRAVNIRRARLVLPAGPALGPGDVIGAKLRLAPVPGPILPGTHDGQFHAYFSGIGAYGGVTSGLTILARGEADAADRRIESLRTFIAARIDRVLSGVGAAIGKAMIVGDQSGIDDETRDVMAASGLAHVYSISGLHLSIVAGGIFWLARLGLASIPALVGWPIKKIAALAGLVAAFGYLLLAGGPGNVPAFRSTLMLALIFGAVLAGRRALTMRNVAIAALVVIVMDPASIFRPSFQLSFAAVLALIGIYEWPDRFGPGASGWGRRFSRFVLAAAWTSFIAGAATLLFSAYHFQQTAPLGVAGNILALVFVSGIMWFGVLAVLSMPLGLDGPFLRLMGWNIERMVDIAELVAGWSAGLTGNPILADWTLLAAVFALAWFAFFETRWRLLAPAVLVPLILIWGFAPRPDVLIADTTQAVAIRHGAGLALASGQTGSFAVDVWGRHYQSEIAPRHPQARCDSLGCVVATKDFTIAIIRKPEAFAEDCGGHDLVVARIRPPKWCAGLVIGADQLARGGMHWLVWDAVAGRFIVRAAIAPGQRPWRIARR